MTTEGKGVNISMLRREREQHRKPLKKVQLQNKAQEGKSVRCTPTLSTHLALSAIFRVVFSVRGRWACCEGELTADNLIGCSCLAEGEGGVNVAVLWVGGARVGMKGGWVS